MSLSIHLYFRHYVGNRKTLNVYKEIVNNLIEAKIPKNFFTALYLNYNAKLSEKMKNKIFEVSEPLIENDIVFSVKIAHGAGNAFLDVLEESVSIASIDRKKFVVVLVDADQYPLNKKEFYSDIANLCEHLTKENALLGCALRTKVMLGKGKLNILRQIEEMYHALFIRKKVKFFEKPETTLPCYRELGDPVPGCYAINTLHKNFFSLLKCCFKDSLHSNLNKYAGDPYIVMKASELGKIVQSKVTTKHNPPGEFTLKAMREKNRYLLKTSIRKKYLRCVSSDKNARLLEKYFSRKDIEKVRSIILTCR
jgi:hypothetical protein